MYKIVSWVLSAVALVAGAFGVVVVTAALGDSRLLRPTSVGWMWGFVAARPPRLSRVEAWRAHSEGGAPRGRRYRR